MSEKIWGTLDPFYEGGPFLGRIVANTGFLHALLKRDPFDQYHFFLSSQKIVSNCQSYLKRNFHSKLDRIKFYSRTELINCLSTTSYHVFHLSDCINNPAHLARLRNRYAGRIFPVTSITHSLSYSSYSLQLLKQLWPGWSSKDVIVCSSECARNVLDRYFRHLRTSFSLNPDFQPPGMTQIPLGIDFEQFQLRTKSTIPAGLLDKNKVNILCLGRISCYSKMDILPILRGFQLAGIYGLDINSTRLVLAGGLDQKDDTVKKLSLFARNIGLEIRIIPNPDNKLKKRLLHDADIFVSLADNPQETFGLTILEAQAAGLPVVASDYNGYRELIDQQENGFLIPTLGPDNTDYIDELAPLVYDSESHLLLAQSCAVDLHALARTLARLIADPQLRQKTAENGRQNARQYDWPLIIDRYIELWEMLNSKPDGQHKKDIKHPVHTPYSDIFAEHTTDSWINSVVCIGKLGKAVYRGKDHLVIYSGIDGIIDQEKIRMLLFLARTPHKCSSLIARLCASLNIDPSTARLVVAWSIKQGLLQTS